MPTAPDTPPRSSNAARIVIVVCAVAGIAASPLSAQTLSQAVAPRAQYALLGRVDWAIGRETRLPLVCHECLDRGAFGSATNHRHDPLRAIQSEPSHRKRNIVIGAILGAVAGGIIGERVGQRSLDDLCSHRDCGGPPLTPIYDAAYGAAIGVVVGGVLGWVWPSRS
jgi:hypothetical protein